MNIVQSLFQMKLSYLKKKCKAFCFLTQTLTFNFIKFKYVLLNNVNVINVNNLKEKKNQFGEK